MSRLSRSIVNFWRRWEHHIGVGGIAAGFIFDLFLAKRPDSVADNILLICYLFIAGAIIILLNARTRRQMETESPAEPLFLLLILQFCFGGLASNLLVLYGHSGTLAGSTLFIMLLATMVFGNEFLRSRYAQLRFNIVVLYMLLFSYLIIAVPTFVIHAIGDWVFIFTGIASLGIIALFLLLVYAAVLRGRTRVQQLYEVSMLVFFAFLLMNGLYFLNIIPPVPLSLQGIGIYHSLSRDTIGDYRATYEKAPWWAFWSDTSDTFTAQPGQAAYCFSSIYAPSSLQTPVQHIWEFFDPGSKQWVTIARSSFTIVGGREGGYRGYSMVTSLAPGAWRCDVETQSGALIGRMSFSVVESSTTPVFNETTL